MGVEREAEWAVAEFGAALLGDALAADAHQEGLWVHSTLALTPEGLVLGVLAQEQWTRAVGAQGMAARRGRTTAEKESHKWLGGLDATDAAARGGFTTHWIARGDRECDLYDVSLRTRHAGAHRGSGGARGAGSRPGRRPRRGRHGRAWRHGRWGGTYNLEGHRE